MMKRNAIMQMFIFSCLCLLLFRSNTHAQSGDNIIYLHHADSLVGLEINGEQARQLIGNVKFTHGKTVVTCKRATQFLKSNRVNLEGNVVVVEDSLTMRADHGIYYGDTRISEASGNVRLDENTMQLFSDFGSYYSKERMAHFRQNVRVIDSTSILTADDLVYYRDEQKTVAESNVVIVSSENNLTIRGGHFENYRKVKYSLMLDRPRAVHIDTTGGTTDSVVIISDTMETYQKTPERLLASGNVSMKRSDVTSQSGSTMYYTKLDSIELRGTPFVWQTQLDGTTTQSSGDSMFIKLDQKRLRVLYLHGHAFTISQADPTLLKRLHQVSGQDMTMFFKENKVNNIEVDRTATILYYLFDDKTPDGMNHTSGDHVSIDFLLGKINQLKVTGGVEGKYVPERILNGHEEDYNLTGFNWKEKPIVK